LHGEFYRQRGGLASGRRPSSLAALAYNPWPLVRPMTSPLETIRTLNQQAWALCKKDSLAAITLARQASSLIAECPQAEPLDEFECLKTQAYCLDILGQPQEALLIGGQANRLAEQIGDNYLVGSIQSILGRIYWHIEDFAASLNYYLSALQRVQNENHPDLEISLINGLGLVQYGLENYAEALGYFKTCLEKARSDDLTGRADASNNIAYVLHMLGRDAEALEYGLAALALFNQLGTSVGKLETLQSLGAIHLALGNYDQAMAFLEAGLALARQNNSQILAISYVLEMSRIHQLQGQLDQAEEELLLALPSAEGLNSLTNISLLHERLVEIYKAKRDYAAALAHFEAFHLTYRQVFNDKSDRRVKNLEIMHQVEISRKQAELYRELASTDYLTRLVNRRRFLEIAELEFQRARLEHGPLGVMLLDVDHFKSVNDRFGHKAGDEVLSAVGLQIRKSLRQGDVAGRYGGEEFVVLVVGSSPEQCANIAERIRQSVAQLDVQLDQALIRVSLSLGLVCVNDGSVPPVDDVIQLADQAMYQAKQQGRNRVVVWAAAEKTAQVTET
jgi:diguanylate cyclase (GGDEF)-like protein